MSDVTPPDSLPASESGDAPHPAVFASASVHFTLSTNASTALDITKASRRLLAVDLAASAAWPDSAEIYVPERVRKQAKRLFRSRRLQVDYSELQQSLTWPKGIGFFLSHLGDHHIGRLGLMAVWARHMRLDLERIQTNPVAVRDLVGFFVRHPIFALHRVLPKLSYHRSNGSQEATTPAFDDSSAGLAEETSVGDSATGLIAQAAETEADAAATKAEIEADAKAEEADEFDDLKRMLDDAERIYLEQQVVSAAERVIDAELLGGRDREQERFVRVLLRQSYHQLLVPGRDDAQTAVFEPRLFLHESGAVQLTIQFSMEGPLSTRDVVRMMRGQGLFLSSRIPRPIIQGTRWEPLAKWSGEMDVQAELADLEYPKPVSMIDLLRLHLEAVGRVIGTDLPQNWLNYPTGTLAAGDCCPPGEWQHVHEVDIKKVMLRFDSEATVAPHVKLSSDLSSTTQHSLFTNMATTAYFQWIGVAPRGLPELDTTLVVEYALYLYWRLQMLEDEASRFRLGDRRLRRLYRRSILVFAELRQGNLRSGDTRRIASQLLQDLGGDQLRTTVETALNLSAEAFSTVSASRASLRAWWLALLGTLLAVLVALSQIQAGLDAVRKWKIGGPWNALLDPVRAVAAWSPWTVLIAAAGVVLIAWALARFVRFGRLFFSILLRRRGYAWPEIIDVSRHSGAVRGDSSESEPDVGKHRGAD